MQGNGKENDYLFIYLFIYSPLCFSLGAWNGGYCKQILKHGTKINMQVTEKKRNKNKFDFLQTTLDC
jgi:hypothetical protein